MVLNLIDLKISHLDMKMAYYVIKIKLYLINDIGNNKQCGNYSS